MKAELNQAYLRLLRYNLSLYKGSAFYRISLIYLNEIHINNASKKY